MLNTVYRGDIGPSTGILWEEKRAALILARPVLRTASDPGFGIFQLPGNLDERSRRGRSLRVEGWVTTLRPSATHPSARTGEGRKCRMLASIKQVIFPSVNRRSFRQFMMKFQSPFFVTAKVAFDFCGNKCAPAWEPCFKTHTGQAAPFTEPLVARCKSDTRRIHDKIEVIEKLRSIVVVRGRMSGSVAVHDHIVRMDVAMVGLVRIATTVIVMPATALELTCGIVVMRSTLPVSVHFLILPSL